LWNEVLAKYPGNAYVRSNLEQVRRRSTGGRVCRHRVTPAELMGPAVDDATSGILRPRRGHVPTRGRLQSTPE